MRPWGFVMRCAGLPIAPALMLALPLAFAACGRPATVTSPVTMPPGVQPVVLQVCDDGGDGGVLIDGVCL